MNQVTLGWSSVDITTDNISLLAVHDTSVFVRTSISSIFATAYDLKIK